MVVAFAAGSGMCRPGFVITPRIVAGVVLFGVIVVVVVVVGGFGFALTNGT